MTRARWIALGAIAVATAVAAGLLSSGSEGEATPYRTAKVERGPLVQSVTAAGAVAPVVSVIVGSQLSGQIKEVPGDFNMAVTRGQVIARLDTRELEARRAQAVAERAAAEAALARATAEAERAAADVESAEAAVENARLLTDKAKATAGLAARDLARRGDLVRKGAVSKADADRADTTKRTAEADRGASEAQLRSAQSALVAARAAAAVAAATIAGARADLDQRNAAVALVDVDLDRAEIRAPIDGVIIQRQVDVGQTVAASLQAPVLFTIAQDLRQVQVLASVDEADIGRTAPGQPATFSVAAYPGRTFEGVVEMVRIGPNQPPPGSAVPATGIVTYTVVVRADNADLALRPGMTASVRIVTAHADDVLRVPNAALRWQPGRAALIEAQNAGFRGAAAEAASARVKSDVTGTVFVLGPDGTPKPVEVRIGIGDAGFTQIVGGDLKAGDTVVVGGGRARADAQRTPFGT